MKRTHPALSVPVIVDLDECLASVRDIAASYDRLKELCMPSSEEELKTQDPTWFSSVQNTMWLQVYTERETREKRRSTERAVDRQFR